MVCMGHRWSPFIRSHLCGTCERVRVRVKQDAVPLARGLMRDFGSGFKARCEPRTDGRYQVTFYRNGRSVLARVFRAEDDALMFFTGITREKLRSLLP